MMINGTQMIKSRKLEELVTETKKREPSRGSKGKKIKRKNISKNIVPFYE